MRIARIDRTARSSGGCIGCRNRKRKCDETHPECNECSSRGLRCPGFRTRARFLPYEPQSRTFDRSKSNAISRQFLASTSRVGFESGNSTLLETFGPARSHTGVLDGFRTGQENNDEPPSFQMSRFGSLSPHSDAPDTSAWEDGINSSRERNTTATACVQENDIVHTSNSRAQEHLSFSISENRVERSGSYESINYVQPRGSGTANLLGRTFVTPKPQLCLNLGGHLSVLSRSESVVHLMAHFQDIAETFFSPRRTSKLPWVVMHLPKASSTLARIASGEKPKSVQTALLNAVLSVSAFNLDKMNIVDARSDIWWVLGQSFRSHSKLDMQKHLSLELKNPDSTEYIETLMALLTMATSSIIGGLLSEVRPFLLDAETCICRYVRNTSTTSLSQTGMLHQIFLFQRIIEESTFIYPALARCAPPEGPAQLEYRALRFPSLQTVHFRMGTEPPNSFLEAVLRGTNTDYEDAPSMFEEIYGIPESLLSLLSKATSLSNEIRSYKKGRDNDPLLDPNLIIISKKLETDILRWRVTELGTDDASYVDNLIDLNAEPDSGCSKVGSSGETAIENRAQNASNTLVLQASTSLNLAIHHGILIYFHRRISNLDPSLLQFHVDAIMKLLRHCRHEMTKAGIINCGIVWPGFIAAAEALGRARQAAIRSFLHESTRISGMRSFDIAADVAEEVWRLRTEKGDAAVSWVNVLAEQGRTVILT